MPRRRDKRTDTENSDDFQQQANVERVTHFGSVQANSLISPDQLPAEDATKYSILAWSNNLNAQRLLPWEERKQLFERVLQYLPYSYKIWHMYLKEFIQYCSSRSLYSKEYTLMNETFQLALSRLPKMPRIWLMYAESLQKQNKISKVREVYNWSFRNLPLTQHQKIWKQFTKWCMGLQSTSTALAVIPRYLKINPDFKQFFADYLYEKGLYDYCVRVLGDILKDDGYSSRARMSKQDFHLRIVDIVTDHPEEVTSTDGAQTIRDAIEKYEDSRGALWVKLSDYYTKKGDFDQARSCLEEALDKIDNVKDFGVIFGAYCKFEQEMITALADEENRAASEVVKEDYVDEQIQARLQKLQSLIKRRPYLLHKINLRKVPNNVKQWINLSRLYSQQNDQQKQLQILEQALERIKPSEVSEGKLSDVVVEMAKVYQNQRDIQKVSEIMHKGTTIPFSMIDDYYNIWVTWAEIMLEEGYYQDALKIIKHILFKKRAQAESEAEIKIRNSEDLLKSHTGIWQFYIDLEISLGTFQSLKMAYERCKQHRCLTPIMLINFTNFLWENSYFQQSFRVFEYAVGNFTWPALFEIWLCYITKFISRCGSDGIGVERTRSMFERVIKQCPKDKAKIFYFLYAEFQQEYGLYSHAIQIYDRMVNTVPENDRCEAYNIYIAKVAKLLGITKSRAIFQAALQKLNEKQTLEMGRKYADIQTKMGELQRARAIYTYISQFTDPRDDRKKIWKEWQAFQVQNGNQQTYKQYRRVKRSVQNKYLMLPPDLQKIQQEVKRGLIQQQQEQQEYMQN